VSIALPFALPAIIAVVLTFTVVGRAVRVTASRGTGRTGPDPYVRVPLQRWEHLTAFVPGFLAITAVVGGMRIIPSRAFRGGRGWGAEPYTDENYS
jgi:hypothetical protein